MSYNGRSFALIGFCKRLVCANLRKGCVSSLVIFSFLRWGAVDFITLIINELQNN